MYQSPNRVHVANTADLHMPVMQEHFFINGIVQTTVPHTGQSETGLTDDFGNLVPFWPVMDQWLTTMHDFNLH